MKAFVASERSRAIKDKRRPEFSSEAFHKWAASDLKSPRSIWLYFMCISNGCMLVTLRAAIRFVVANLLIGFA